LNGLAGRLIPWPSTSPDRALWAETTSVSSSPTPRAAQSANPSTVAGQLDAPSRLWLNQPLIKSHRDRSYDLPTYKPRPF